MASSHCVENPPVNDASSGGGAVIESLGGLKAYAVGSVASAKAVVLISDVFGYEAPNLRNLADKVASFGYYVVVPDFFFGDPLVPSENIMELFKEWKLKHGTDKGFEDAERVIHALHEQGILSIGVAGFCWGGVVVSKLTKFDYIKAGVILHPGKIDEDDIKEAKVPISILGAETDHASPPEVLKKFGEILSASGVDGFVKIFPGVTHGWSVRYELSDATAVAKAEEAHKDMIDWFLKHVN